MSASEFGRMRHVSVLGLCKKAPIGGREKVDSGYPGGRLEPTETEVEI